MEEEQVIEFLMDGAMSSSSDDDSSSSSGYLESEDEVEDHLNEVDDEIREEELMFPLFQILLNGRRLQRVQDFLETVHAKSDIEFKQDFRIQRRVAYLLLQSLEASGYIPTHQDGKEKVSAELSLLMTLWFLANKDSHRTLANLFNISFSSVSRVMRRVVNWLVTLVPEFIKWPEGNEIAKTSNDFEVLAGIHGCIGAIDGCHICIDQPETIGREYYNRKQSYSINLQGVVDSKLKFINIYCGDPGSYHDVRVLRRSELYANTEENRETVFPHDTFLLGDKGYNGVGKKWIICPYRDNGQLTIEQNEFNARLSRTRVVVERAFGILKGRFRRLQKIQLRNMEFIVKIVVACCVLHNICLENGDDGEEVYVEDAGMEQDGLLEDGDIENRGRNEDRREQLFREMFM